MDQHNSHDPNRGNSYASSRYTTTDRAYSNSSSSIQPLIQGEESRLQPSATFYPSAHDDYFTPYGIDWGTGDFVSTPPPISSPQEHPSQTRTQSFFSDVSTPLSYPASPPDLTPGYAGVGVAGRSTASGGNPSPPGGPAIFTPSTGSSPSASSPPQQAAAAIQPPPSAMPAIGAQYADVDRITSSEPTTFRSSVSSMPERKPSAPSKGFGRSGSTSRWAPTRLSRGNMLPLHENEALETKEIETQQLDPMEYSEETGGWIRKKGGNIVRSLTRKMTTYRRVNGEDRELRKANRAATLRNDENNASAEGYVAVDYDMFDSFDSEVPERTADAMRNNNGNVDFAYTATGEVVDLSSLQGLGADDDLVDFDGKSRRDSFALTPRPTGFTTEKSYYFPEDPDTPNWKPLTMRPIYLTILQFLALCIIGFCEFLYQYSVMRAKGTKFPPHITKFLNLESMSLIYFALWKYLPTVIAVIFGVLVQLTDAEVKRVEPYFQLSRKPKGARAADSLNIEYLTFWAILCPIQAIRHKHWAVMLSSVTAILAFAAVPPLQSVFLDLSSSGDNDDDDKDWKFIVVHPIWTRLLEAVMFVIFIQIGALQWILLRRKTGLVGDPSGIAGVAAMANKAHILMDFKGLDLAGTAKIHKQLNKRTYILHKACLWQAEFLKEHERPTESARDQNAHPLLLRFQGGIPLIIYLLGVMVMIVIMFRPGTTIVIGKSTWFLTALSISIKMFWEVIDRDLRILQPFYLLYKRHAHPDVLTLDYTSTITGWIIVKTIQNKHYLLTYITTITLLNEVLTVCMGSLDSALDEETPRSQIVSLALSVLIMFGQVIGVIVVLCLRRHPFLPRQPGTISSVLAYIYASHMLTDFDHMENKETNERRKMLAAKGKTYGFGWFKGLVDGKWHLGIDQEELLRSYKHGDRFLESVVQGVPSGLDHY